MECPGVARVFASWLEKISVNVVKLNCTTDIVTMFLIWGVLRTDWLLRDCESPEGRVWDWCVDFF